MVVRGQRCAPLIVGPGVVEQPELGGNGTEIIQTVIEQRRVVRDDFLGCSQKGIGALYLMASLHEPFGGEDLPARDEQRVGSASGSLDRTLQVELCLVGVSLEIQDIPEILPRDELPAQIPPSGEPGTCHAVVTLRSFEVAPLEVPQSEIEPREIRLMNEDSPQARCGFAWVPSALREAGGGLLVIGMRYELGLAPRGLGSRSGGARGEGEQYAQDEARSARGHPSSLVDQGEGAGGPPPS